MDWRSVYIVTCYFYLIFNLIYNWKFTVLFHKWKINLILNLMYDFL